MKLAHGKKILGVSGTHPIPVPNFHTSCSLKQSHLLEEYLLVEATDMRRSGMMAPSHERVFVESSQREAREDGVLCY